MVDIQDLSLNPSSGKMVNEFEWVHVSPYNNWRILRICLKPSEPQPGRNASFNIRQSATLAALLPRRMVIRPLLTVLLATTWKSIWLVRKHLYMLGELLTTSEANHYNGN